MTCLMKYSTLIAFALLLIAEVRSRRSTDTTPWSGAGACGRRACSAGPHRGRSVRRVDDPGHCPHDQHAGLERPSRELHRQHLLPRRPAVAHVRSSATSAFARGAAPAAVPRSRGFDSTSTATPPRSSSSASSRSCSTTWSRILPCSGNRSRSSSSAKWTCRLRVWSTPG